MLWNNAGVMVPPQGSKTKQGYELQLGTNNVAPFLFTKLLTPILIKTAKVEPPGTVRVVWTSSTSAETSSPQNGVEMDNLDYKVDKGPWHKYGVSKAGNILHSKEYAARYAGEGIISVVCCCFVPFPMRSGYISAYAVQSLNPGNLKTPLQRHVPGWQMVLLNLLLHTPIHGAYTELFAGLSPDITPELNGAWSKSSLLLFDGHLLMQHSHSMGPLSSSPKGYRGRWQVREGRRNWYWCQLLGVE